MSKQIRIATFGHTIDPYYIGKRHHKNLFVILPKTAKNLHRLYKNKGMKVINVDLKSMSPIEDFSDTELLSSRNLIKHLKQNKITHFLVSHRSSKKLFSICKSAKIIPIGNTPDTAGKLENKLFFDRLMDQLKITKPKVIKIHKNEIKARHIPCVVQKINSFGSFGTTIVKELKDLTNLKNIPKNSTLVRKYEKGNIYGITMIIHTSGIILSAIRQQCYYSNTAESDFTFAGIQWIKTGAFSKKTLKVVQDNCRKIASYLKKRDFTGIIHFDFIVNNKGKVFFLECNPRPSSANPHLLSQKELLSSKIDFSSIALGNFSNLPNLDVIPNSKYEGSLFDLMALVTINDKPIETDAIHRSIKHNLFSSRASLVPSPKGSFMGTIISDRKLFSPNGQLNREAIKLYKHYTGIRLR